MTGLNYRTHYRSSARSHSRSSSTPTTDRKGMEGKRNGREGNDLLASLVVSLGEVEVEVPVGASA